MEGEKEKEALKEKIKYICENSKELIRKVFQEEFFNKTKVSSVSDMINRLKMDSVVVFMPEKMTII